MNEQQIAKHVADAFYLYECGDHQNLFKGYVEAIEDENLLAELNCKDCHVFAIPYQILSRVDRVYISVQFMDKNLLDCTEEELCDLRLSELLQSAFLKVCTGKMWIPMSPLNSSIKWFWIATLSLIDLSG